MPAAKKPLDSVFEVDEPSGKVRCRECFQADPDATGWMARGSAPRHLKDSDKHKSSIAINLWCQEADTSHHERLSLLMRTQVMPHSTLILLIPLHQHKLGFLTWTIGRSLTLGIKIMISLSAGISPHQHDAEAEREQLRREVELMMMKAEQLDEMGLDQLEDDPTVTNVAHELSLLDDDVIIQDSFAETINHGDYYPSPYGSNRHASHRPGCVANFAIGHASRWPGC
ncbi:hypothetical protein PILCRDRAFT_10519 [Piloderma croceum F 1598]|uniref:Uncharacterized protein n=1 Tax=Piloderma croceum (strain F 1598) TaxID=765440 RepID=A0A0C3AZG4_PILCF|nr:hypothetical protein PILCRDRAFT_10519 [Piloderma croceum F 1598]